MQRTIQEFFRHSEDLDSSTGPIIEDLHSCPDDEVVESQRDSESNAIDDEIPHSSTETGCKTSTDETPYTSTTSSCDTDKSQTPTTKQYVQIARVSASVVRKLALLIILWKSIIRKGTSYIAVNGKVNRSLIQEQFKVVGTEFILGSVCAHQIIKCIVQLAEQLMSKVY